MLDLMWSYQTHFCGAQQAAAKRVFQELDPRFDPQVLLVGFLARPSTTGRPPVCIEPGEDFWLTPADFAGVELVQRRQFATLEGAPAESDSNPGLQGELQLRKAIREAVSGVIAREAGFPAELTYFVSMPSRVERYWVCAAVGLQTERLRTLDRLSAAEVVVHGRRVRVPTSLTDAAMLEFLEQIALELARPQPGRELSQIEPEETLRAAGRRLMNGLVWRIDDRSVEGMPDLFRTFNTVSSLNYERKAGSGTLFIARRGHPALETRLEFSASARMRHHGHARKLLELTSTELALHTDADRIFGLVHVHPERLKSEEIFEVQITGHHQWELLHARRPFMRVQYGQPTLPKTRIDERKLRIDLVRIFEGIDADDCDCLVDLVTQAVEESHGTMLVISADAPEEARRLGAQCIPVKPRRMTSDLLRHVTPIDGAVLLSPDGRCHAIGTILDGIAAGNGDASRGARYNSAVRYVASTQAACLAVVVSEDGRVDYVPDLLPPISRSEIDYRLLALDRIRAAQPLKRRVYHEIIRWFDEHRFYLLKEHCDRLNDLISEIEARLEANEPELLTTVHGPYLAHADMNPRLFYIQSDSPLGTETLSG